MRLALLVTLSALAGFAVATTGADAASVVAGTRAPCVLRASNTSGVNQAGLSVTFDDGTMLRFCIEFSEDAITGAELLRRSGLSIVTAGSGGLGAAVCSIDGEGCNDPGDCFCHCKGGTCEYWGYYRYNNGAWQYSPVGAGTRNIRNGDADAWVWGSGGNPPGDLGAQCVALPPTPSPVPSLAPRPSATPRPAETPVPAEISPTVAPPPAPANPPLPGPPPPTQAVAPAIAAPTSAVLSGARTPPPVGSTVATGTPRAGSTEEPTATRTPGAPTGAIRVSDAEGARNLAGQESGSGWGWRGIATFAGFAAVLACIGGAVVWRRRAGS